MSGPFVNRAQTRDSTEIHVSSACRVSVFAVAGGGVPNIYSHLYHPITFAFAHKLTFEGYPTKDPKKHPSLLPTICYLWLSWNPQKADSYETLFLSLFSPLARQD